MVFSLFVCSLVAVAVAHPADLLVKPAAELSASDLLELFSDAGSGLGLDAHARKHCPLNSEERPLFGYPAGTTAPGAISAESLWQDPGVSWNVTAAHGSSSSSSSMPPVNPSESLPSCCMMEFALHVTPENAMRPYAISDRAGATELSMSYGPSRPLLFP